MDDLREKVMIWLKICGMGDCSECCPYRNGEVRASSCYEQLMTDALSLLKAQEPRLITKDDFEKADAWGTIPAWIEYNPAIEGAEPGWAIIDSDILGSPFKKAWTARPTEEQREAVKWDK